MNACGHKHFELTNLPIAIGMGNVLVVITDQKHATCQADTVTHYTAQVTSGTDYSPFGAPLAGRTWYGDMSGGYRFGFNGMEKIDEVSGVGNFIDYGARVRDPRVGPWLSTDPLSSKYPDLSVYNYVANSPLMFIDPDGKKIVPAANATSEQKQAFFQKVDEMKTKSSVFSTMYDALDADPKIITINFNDEVLDKNGADGGATPEGNVYLRNNLTDKPIVEELFHQFQFIKYDIKTTKQLNEGSPRKSQELESEAKLFNHVVLENIDPLRAYGQYEQDLLIDPDLSNLPNSNDRSIKGEVLTEAYNKYLKGFESKSKGTRYEGAQRKLLPDAYNDIIKKDDEIKQTK